MKGFFDDQINKIIKLTATQIKKSNQLGRFVNVMFSFRDLNYLLTAYTAYPTHRWICCQPILPEESMRYLPKC